MALHSLHLMIGQRRAAAGDDLLHSGSVDADHVHVAFHQYRAIRVVDAVLRAMQVVQNVTLAIDRRFRRVQIFCLLVGIERTASESDNLASLAMDGEYQTMPEAIVEAAIVAFGHEA